MFVRLAFAIVAHLDVDILVIDEALAVGDAFFVQKCMRFLRQFAQRGTLIFVSHDVGSVLSLCDTAIWLENGRLRSAGSPKDLINEYMQALYEDPLSAIKEIETAPARPVSPKSQTPPSADHAKPAHQQSRDIRSELINGSTLRNDIELLPFRPDAADFGTGHAQITDVHFDDEHGQPLSWVIGGEMVALLIDCDCRAALQDPIIGFIIKDRLGQVLFGDNTWLTTRDAPLQVEKGNQLRTRFVFIMPRLPNGDYSVSAAIAEGTITEHRQLHWMHDALTFKVNSSSVYAGLVGIPMIAIELNRID
jgi:lipopolysaccharide transport system ATP-binding protein